MTLNTLTQGFMPTLFNELFDWSNFRGDERQRLPKMNVLENDSAFIVQLCVPGMRKEDLTLSIDTDNHLVVEMSHTNAKDEESANCKYLCHEFQQVEFKQHLRLPDNVKRENISAKAENGILTITLPKISEEEKRSLAQIIAIA